MSFADKHLVERSASSSGGRAAAGTAEEALAEVEKAKDAWLAAASDSGRAIPEPRYRPAIYAG